MFYDVHKENMFTINLEDGREAPSKASSLNLVPGQIFIHFEYVFSDINTEIKHFETEIAFY